MGLECRPAVESGLQRGERNGQESTMEGPISQVEEFEPCPSDNEEPLEALFFFYLKKDSLFW